MGAEDRVWGPTPRTKAERAQADGSVHLVATPMCIGRTHCVSCDHLEGPVGQPRRSLHLAPSSSICSGCRIRRRSADVSFSLTTGSDGLGSHDADCEHVILQVCCFCNLRLGTSPSRRKACSCTRSSSIRLFRVRDIYVVQSCQLVPARHTDQTCLHDCSNSCRRGRHHLQQSYSRR